MERRRLLQREVLCVGGKPAKYSVSQLSDELLFRRAVQSYLWALPILSMYGMKETSEGIFGKGYNILPVWQRTAEADNAISSFNPDMVYAMGYLYLKEDGPMVLETPPGLQGILDDFWQRPLPSEGEIEGCRWSGAVGLPGPDKGRGGKYLVLPPDFTGKIPSGYFPYRSRTYGVFLFWHVPPVSRREPEDPLKIIKQIRIYPIGRKASAKSMRFPDAAGARINMMFPPDGSAFYLLKRIVDYEYVDRVDVDMRGMLAAIGISRDQPFEPDTHTFEILDMAAHHASDMVWSSSKQEVKGRPAGNAGVVDSIEAGTV